MSDDVDASSSGGDDDVSLPKATVYKLISELLPSEMSCAKETRDLLLECCVEFIHLISGEANEICEREQKKTIAPEHIISALRSLGFESYVDEIGELATDHKKQLKERERKGSRFNTLGLSQEELLRQQQELFAQARLRYEMGLSSPVATTIASSVAETSNTATSSNPIDTKTDVSVEMDVSNEAPV